MQSKGEKLPDNPNDVDQLRVINMLINHLNIRFDTPSHREECLRKFKQISYNQLIRPLVIKDREDGMSYGKLSMKYKVTYDTIRYILKN